MLLVSQDPESSRFLICRSSDFQQTIQYTRVLESLGGLWKPVLRGWRIPNILFNRLILSHYFEIEEDLPEEKSSLTFYDRAMLQVDGLFPFQIDAVDHLVSSPLPGNLLSLSPGLGKSAVALKAAFLLEFRRVLIVCPRSLVKTWQRESLRWLNREISDCYSSEPEGDWVVTTYETLRGQYRDSYFSKDWDLLVVDESSRLISRKTLGWKVFRDFRRKHLGKMWALSGTPVRHFVDDLWGQFSLLFPEAFRSYWRFVSLFCDTDTTIWGTRILGSKAGIDFQGLFKDILYVVNSKDVLNLPEASIETLEVPLSFRQNTAYQEMLSTFMTSLESGDIEAKSRLSQMLRLLQITSSLATLSDIEVDSSKHDALCELISEEMIDYPVLIWAHWREGAEQLKIRLEELGESPLILLGGHESPDSVVESFKSGDSRILIMSPGVGKYGLTLTNIKTMIYLDKTFDMEAYIQTMYRFKRIGLEHSVRVISLVSPGTIDELVSDNLATKAFDIHKISNEDLLSLLRSLNRE